MFFTSNSVDTLDPIRNKTICYVPFMMDNGLHQVGVKRWRWGRGQLYGFTPHLIGEQNRSRKQGSIDYIILITYSIISSNS